MTPKQIDARLDMIERSFRTAMRSQLRYSWSPATKTGRAALAASERHEERVVALIAELRAALCGGRP